MILYPRLGFFVMFSAIFFAFFPFPMIIAVRVFIPDLLRILNMFLSIILIVLIRMSERKKELRRRRHRRMKARKERRKAAAAASEASRSS